MYEDNDFSESWEKSGNVNSFSWDEARNGSTNPVKNNAELFSSAVSNAQQTRIDINVPAHNGSNRAVIVILSAVIMILLVAVIVTGFMIWRQEYGDADSVIVESNVDTATLFAEMSDIPDGASTLESTSKSTTSTTESATAKSEFVQSTIASITPETKQTTTSITAVTTAVQKTWQEAYKEQLLRFQNSDSFNDTWPSMYDLFDVDGNGIPELFISEAEYDAATCYIYTYYDSQCVEVGACGSYGMTFVNNLNHYIMQYGGSQGIISLDVFQFDGVTLGFVASFSDNEANAEYEPVEYWKNGVLVSEFDYWTEKEKYDNLETVTVGRKYSFDRLFLDW